MGIRSKLHVRECSTDLEERGVRCLRADFVDKGLTHMRPFGWRPASFRQADGGASPGGDEGR